MTVSTTIRLNSDLKKAVEKRAKDLGVGFSDLTRMLFTSLVLGEISVGATQYPPRYASMIRGESRKMEMRRKKGKAKLYTSAQQMFDDILK